METVAVRAEGLSKDYRLGVLGRKTLPQEIRFLWDRLRRSGPPEGKPGPGAQKMWRFADQMDPERPGWFWALDDVSFEVKAGEILGIIGANGSGKSTLLKILSRVTKPSRGRARLVGRISSLLEVGTGFHPELTGRENVFVNGAILGMRDEEIRSKFDAIVDFAEIVDFIDTPVKRYSSGMRTRLAFAVAAHLDTEVLLLDEVLSVGDASFQNKCLGKMEDMAGHGRTVLLVSHRFSSIVEMCGRVIWIDRGRIRQDGPTEAVVEAYMASVAGSTGERSWSKGFRPRGDARFALFAVSLRNHRGEQVASVDVGHEFSVEIEYALRSPLTSMRLGIEFATLQGAAIFTTLDVDDPGVTVQRDAGRYIASVRVPAGFLAPGRRVVTLSVELPGAVRHFPIKNILSFDVMDGAAPGLAATAMRKGLVRPRLDWRVERVGAPAEGDTDALGGSGADEQS